VTHAYWRIRHAAWSDDIAFDTAPDAGGTPGPWVTRALLPRELPISAMFVELKAGTSVSETVAPGTAAFDNVHVAPITSAREAVLLSDVFNTGALDTGKWDRRVLSSATDPTIAVIVAGGTLRVGPLLQSVSGTHYNGIVSAAPVDMTAAYAAVQTVATPAAASNGFALFSAVVNASNHYRVFVNRGTLFFEKKVSNVKTIVGTVPYDAVADAHWRIRHIAASDQMVFETAPDNGGTPGAWTTRATIARELPLGSVFIELKAGTSTSESTAPGTVAFDNVHVAKPY
jgi:hypothetical protein